MKEWTRLCQRSLCGMFVKRAETFEELVRRRRRRKERSEEAKQNDLRKTSPAKAPSQGGLTWRATEPRQAANSALKCHPNKYGAGVEARRGRRDTMGLGEMAASAGRQDLALSRAWTQMKLRCVKFGTSYKARPKFFPGLSQKQS